MKILHIHRLDLGAFKYHYIEALTFYQGKVENICEMLAEIKEFYMNGY